MQYLEVWESLVRRDVDEADLRDFNVLAPANVGWTLRSDNSVNKSGVDGLKAQHSSSLLLALGAKIDGKKKECYWTHQIMIFEGVGESFERGESVSRVRLATTMGLTSESRQHSHQPPSWNGAVLFNNKLGISSPELLMDAQLQYLYCKTLERARNHDGTRWRCHAFFLLLFAGPEVWGPSNPLLASGIKARSSRGSHPSPFVLSLLGPG